MTEVERQVHRYIVTEIMFDKQGVHLGVDDSLLEGGIIDSMDLQRMLAFLEEHYEVEIPNELLIPEKFETVSAIARMVEQLRDGS